MTTNDGTAYPMRLEGHLDPGLGRWLWLVKWLLLIPHFIVLVFLWIGFVALTVVAFFAILFTGRYPRGIFDFNVGVLRWMWRVQFYAFQANGTDRYPPFTLADVDYPATLSVDYPERLSRGLVLVKWWLLAIPHYIVVAIFAGGGVWLVSDRGEDAVRFGGGLIGVMVLIAVIVLLFTGSYPRSIFDFVMGMNRWVFRVAAYAGLMTDRYPPFRMDMGERDPGVPAIGAAAVGPSAVPHPGRAWTAGRVVLIVVGSLVAMVAAPMLAGGAAAVVVDQVSRDESGFLMSPTRQFGSGNYAIVSETIDVESDGPDVFYVDDLLGTVKLRSESVRDVFVGIARPADVERYLGDVPRDQVRDIARSGTVYRFRPGAEVPSPPAAQPFWVAQSSGGGTQALRWRVEDGRWQVVVMNADASRGVGTRLAIGAELPHLLAIGIGVMVAGAALLVVGGLLIWAGARSPSGPPAPAVEATADQASGPGAQA